MTGEMQMIELESMALVMPEVKGHPNRVDFGGVLTVIDVPSERAPHGAKGRRVLLTRSAAEKAVPSLIGMALDYVPSFDGHDARRKVGVITRAEIVGRNLEVGGYLYGKDFPEIVDEVEKFGRRPGGRREPEKFKRASEGERLRASLAEAAARIRSLTASIGREEPVARRPIVLRAEASGLWGGSALGMSFEVTDVDVVDSRARVWILKRVTFTGAAILRKSKAAYQDTWIEIAR
jgi:hypothetical protein